MKPLEKWVPLIVMALFDIAAISVANPYNANNVPTEMLNGSCEPMTALVKSRFG
jgi:hypothetical protein